jgi:hypothetical protein
MAIEKVICTARAKAMGDELGPRNQMMDKLI